MKKTKKYTIAVVAHDNCKKDLAEWVAFKIGRASCRERV